MKFSQQSIPNMKFRTTEPRGSVFDFKAEMITNPERLFSDTQSRSPLGIVFVVLMILSFLSAIFFGSLKLGYPCAYSVIAFFTFIFLNVLLFPKNRDAKNSYRGQQTFAKFAFVFLGLALVFTLLLQLGVIVMTPLKAFFLAFAVLFVIGIICIIMTIVSANKINKMYTCSVTGVVIGYLDRLVQRNNVRGHLVDFLETTPVIRLNYNGRDYEVYMEEFTPFDENLPLPGQPVTVYFSGDDPYLCRLTPKTPKFTSVTLIGIIMLIFSFFGMCIMGMVMLMELLNNMK